MNGLKASCVVVLVLGATSVGRAGLALAQDGDQPSQSANGTAQAQDQFQRDKATLSDQAHRSVDAADANIDALKSMSKSENGAAKKQHEDLASNLSMLKDHVNKSIDKMNTATINDWNGVRPVVERDVSALNAQLKNAAPITHIPLPPGVGP